MPPWQTETGQVTQSPRCTASLLPTAGSSAGCSAGHRPLPWETRFHFPAPPQISSCEASDKQVVYCLSLRVSHLWNENSTAPLPRGTLRINTVNSELLRLEGDLDKHHNGPTETKPSGTKGNSHAKLNVWKKKITFHWCLLILTHRICFFFW